jgi:hypothetical protein
LLDKLISSYHEKSLILSQVIDENSDFDLVQSLDQELEKLRLQIVLFAPQNREDLKMQFSFLIDQIGLLNDVNQANLEELSRYFQQALALPPAD